mmetsp:Transcript_1997/g.5033  ORF Transcript_1997/g.5033 Transcript_1997/m.5033 type:complete len:220 (-) Transcript_1997:92-751(-)
MERAVSEVGGARVAGAGVAGAGDSEASGVGRNDAVPEVGEARASELQVSEAGFGGVREREGDVEAERGLLRAPPRDHWRADSIEDPPSSPWPPSSSMPFSSNCSTVPFKPWSPGGSWARPFPSPSCPRAAPLCRRKSSIASSATAPPSPPVRGSPSSVANGTCCCSGKPQPSSPWGATPSADPPPGDSSSAVTPPSPSPKFRTLLTHLLASSCSTSSSP